MTETHVSVSVTGAHGSSTVDKANSVRADSRCTLCVRMTGIHEGVYIAFEPSRSHPKYLAPNEKYRRYSLYSSNFKKINNTKGVRIFSA